MKSGPTELQEMSLPYSEAELLDGITAELAHADELALLLPEEIASDQ